MTRRPTPSHSVERSDAMRSAAVSSRVAVGHDQHDPPVANRSPWRDLRRVRRAPIAGTRESRSASGLRVLDDDHGGALSDVESAGGGPRGDDRRIALVLEVEERLQRRPANGGVLDCCTRSSRAIAASSGTVVCPAAFASGCSGLPAGRCDHQPSHVARSRARSETRDHAGSSSSNCTVAPERLPISAMISEARAGPLS